MKKIVLHIEIKKYVIYYHSPKLVVRFKSGKAVTLVDSEDDMVDYYIVDNDMLDDYI